MKFVLVIVVLPVLILNLATPLNAASPKEARSAAVSDPSQVQLWEDHEKLKDLKVVLFEFDTHESACNQTILKMNAQWLKDHPNVRFRIAGYADLRGEIVYNLALSQRRAETVKQELIRMGIAESRIERATSWGSPQRAVPELCRINGAMLGTTATCRVSSRD